MARDTSTNLPQSGKVPNPANETQVIEALNQQRAVNDEGYVKQVLENYADNRKKEGDDDQKISEKLNIVLNRFPHYKNIVDEITNARGLPPCTQGNQAKRV